jgi:hypothetical protein
MVAGFAALRKGFDTATASAYGVLRWWSDGVVATTPGCQFITELPGSKCMMTVAYLIGADGGAVAEVGGTRGRQTVASTSRYFEIAGRPGQHVNSVQTIVQHRIERRHAEGVYPAPKPITVVVVDAMGEFPAASAPTDIAAGDEDSTDIASGAESIVVRFVAAEDGFRGRLMA